MFCSKIKKQVITFNKIRLNHKPVVIPVCIYLFYQRVRLIHWRDFFYNFILSQKHDSGKIETLLASDSVFCKKAGAPQQVFIRKFFPRMISCGIILC